MSTFAIINEVVLALSENTNLTRGVIMTDWDGARTKADEVLKRYSIDVPPVDVFDIASNEGIEIRYFEPTGKLADYKNVSGLLDSNDGQYKVFINTEESAERQAFTLAHELGHYFLKHKPSEFGVYLRNSLYAETKPPAEQEADLFAAELLMPGELLLKFMKENGLTKDNVTQLATAFGVSTKAMQFRLKNL